MNVGDVWQRTILRRAALRYADHGWAVVPGAMFIRDRYVCGPMCLTVSCHPAVDRWEITASRQSSDVDSWWVDAPFSVLLPTGLAFDVIEVPAHLGAASVRQRVVGPVAAAPTGRWMFLVCPGHGLRPELASRLDVVLHGRGSWIPAPPTRTPSGRWRWRIHPGLAHWRLPDPYAVQAHLLAHFRR